MQSTPTSSDRRRQWLISRGLLSPSGPSRRLGGLLPSTRRARSADVDVRLDTRATPILLAGQVSQCEDARPVPRAVSMPTEQEREDGFLKRGGSTGVVRPDFSGPEGGKRRRFWKGRWKRGKGNPSATTVTPPGRRVMVVDRGLPRGVLDGRKEGRNPNGGQEWEEYRKSIDQLGEDDTFMEYLTEGVEGRGVEGEQLAVNKLYPLAFIRLLEAQARYNGDRDVGVVDPEEELHRYDDLDGEDEDKVIRTASSGVYDMGRFKTVGSVGGSGSIAYRRSEDFVGLIHDRKHRPIATNSNRPQYGAFRSRIHREGRNPSVSVC